MSRNVNGLNSNSLLGIIVQKSTSESKMVFNIDNATINGVDDVLEASYRNEQNVDFPLTKVGRAEYQSFAAKTQTGTPTQYFVQRFIDRVTITLFLTPGATEAGNFINYYF